MLKHIVAALVVRWHEVTDRSERDRGDNPVPTAVIIAGLVILAVAVVAWAVAKANSYMNPPASPGK